MDVGKLLVQARQRAAQALELLKEGAFELGWDVRDAAKTGFGVPGLVSSTASLGVATVAAAGGASVAFDFVGKVWGKKECETCNGWEGMRCQICRGTGQVQYNVIDTTLTKDERVNSRSAAAAAVDGRAEIEYLAVNSELPFPFIDCPQCDATGVMKCRTCNGNAWVPKFTIAKAMNAPWLAWDAYQKIEPPSEPVGAIRIHPEFHDKYVPDGLERDGQNDGETQQPVVPEEYKDVWAFDAIREEIAKREPGWETLQEALIANDPLRAAEDPVVVTDPAYYMANLKIMDEVQELPVPPRPADWMSMEKPLSESDFPKEEFKDPMKRLEISALLEEQEDFYNKLSDRTWENHWRTQKFEEVKKQMIESYQRDENGHQQPVADLQRKNLGASQGSTEASKAKQEKAVPRKKVDTKKRPEDDRKKRERQERSERMARQAAEREEALSRAKEARERKDGP